ncbi:MAG: hypothetical protein OXH57_02140 [Ekhidna sp.]|nr:hypothetical protein [Ekhidna sp.]
MTIFELNKKYGHGGYNKKKAILYHFKVLYNIDIRFKIFGAQARGSESKHITCPLFFYSIYKSN